MKVIQKIICIFFVCLICLFGIKKYNQKINQNEVYLLGKIMYIEANDSNIQNDEEKENLVNATYKQTGVVSCIDLNNRFISVGHSIGNGNALNGNCYKANGYYINRSSNEKIGTIKTCVDTSKKIGEISENLEIGIVGSVDKNYNLKNNKSIKVASMFQVKKEKAKIYLDLEDFNKKYYDIEIISIDYLESSKNIKFKVIDEDLIKLTGGLVQGMSGTPIIQNDKIIGIFNSISLTNPKVGYGVFIDKFF